MDALYFAVFLFAVQIAAGVAPMRWPQHAWLAGVIFWVSCMLAVLCLAFWANEHREALVAGFSSIHVIAAGLVLTAGGLLWGHYGRPSASPTPEQVKALTAPLEARLTAANQEIEGLKRELAKPISGPSTVTPSPALRRPYSGASKEILDKDLAFISGQLNEVGLEVANKARILSNRISTHPVATTWDRFEPLRVGLPDLLKSLDQMKVAIRQRVQQHPYQAEDLNDVIGSDGPMDEFRESIARINRQVGHLKGVFDNANGGGQENAAYIFADQREGFANDVNRFSEWIKECNRRVEVKIRALSQ